MAFFSFEFDTISAAIGGGTTWLLQQVFGLVTKRRVDRGANVRKSLNDQCAAATTRTADCLARTVESLTSDCSTARRAELARLIRHDCMLLGQALKQANELAAELNVARAPNVNLIALRKAATWHLDSKSFKVVGSQSAEVREVYRAGLAFQGDLATLVAAAA